MIITTKDFQEVANKILLAAGLDDNAANLELVAQGDTLYLNVTNREYYVRAKLNIDSNIDFHATVNAASPIIYKL